MDNLTPITREEILMNDEPLTPITREEKILAGEDLNPVTRREYFLKKYRHAGGDVMVEGLSATANGTYTAPEGKAYSPVEVNVPLPENAYLLKTASGSLVSFSDGADLPMPSFICNIDAVQDLHGYDGPWVGGAGKNKLPYTSLDGTYGRGVVVKTNSDGSISFTGTPTETFYITALNFALPQGTYTFSRGNDITSASDLFTRIINTDTSTNIFTLGNSQPSATFTLSATTNLRLVIFTSEIASISGKLYPMIEVGLTATSYAPYSNICPISGHTGVDAWVRGKNLFEPYAESKKINASGEIVNSDNTNVGKAFVKDGVTYTISLSHDNTVTDTITERYAFYDGSNNILETGSMSYKPSTTPNPYKEITAPPNAAILYMDYRKVTTNQQIEIGEKTTFEPYNPNSQTIQVSWQTEAGEVFGGYVDLVSGELTVDKGSVDLGSLNWMYETSATRFKATNMPTNYKQPSSSSERYQGMSCSCYQPNDSPIITSLLDGTISGYEGNKNIYLYDFTYTDADALKTARTGQKLVYPIATPITYQLTPHQIKSLRNTNAWCSTGDVDIDYFAKEVKEYGIQKRTQTKGFSL